MIDVLLYVTGAVVWLLIAIYVFPVIPPILLALLEVVLQKTGNWWSERYLEGDIYGKEAYEEYKELREEGYWKTEISHGEVVVRRNIEKVRHKYMDVIDPLYSRLPGL